MFLYDPRSALESRIYRRHSNYVNWTRYLLVRIREIVENWNFSIVHDILNGSK